MKQWHVTDNWYRPKPTKERKESNEGTAVVSWRMRVVSLVKTPMVSATSKAAATSLNAIRRRANWGGGGGLRSGFGFWAVSDATDRDARAACARPGNSKLDTTSRNSRPRRSSEQVRRMSSLLGLPTLGPERSPSCPAGCLPRGTPIRQCRPGYRRNGSPPGLHPGSPTRGAPPRCISG